MDMDVFSSYIHQQTHDLQHIKLHPLRKRPVISPPQNTKAHLSPIPVSISEVPMSLRMQVRIARRPSNLNI